MFDHQKDYHASKQERYVRVENRIALVFHENGYDVAAERAANAAEHEHETHRHATNVGREEVYRNRTDHRHARATTYERHQRHDDEVEVFQENYREAGKCRSGEPHSFK